MFRSLLMVTALVVAGCADHSPEAEARAEAAALAADDAKCKASGLQPGTPAFEKCLTQLADQRAGADNTNRADLMNRLQGRPPTWAQH